MAKPGVSAALAAGLAALCWMGEARADEAQRQAMARELVELTDVTTTMNELFQTMAPMMAEGSARELDLSAAETARLGEILQEEFAVSMPDMMSAVTASYASALSEQELTEILAFLRTPSGRALLLSQTRMQDELERQGQIIGMQVVLRALTRFNGERTRGGAEPKR